MRSPCQGGFCFELSARSDGPRDEISTGSGGEAGLEPFQRVEGVKVGASGEMGNQVCCSFGDRDGGRKLEEYLGGERGEHD